MAEADSSPVNEVEVVETAPAAPPGKPGTADRPAAPGLLDRIVETTPARRPEGTDDQLERFLAEESAGRSLRLWLGDDVLRRLEGRGKRALLRRLGRDLARIDTLLSGQVDAIVHHPRFQRLEASWRGLSYLVEGADEEEGVKVRMLNASKKELFKDSDRAVEFDQSKLFQKVYSDEFDMPGGEPFGVLIGDYEFSNHPQDVQLLEELSHIAAAAFSPFIAGADPELFGTERFAELERPQNIGAIFEQEDYVRWRALRDTEDARFVGLTLPRVLMRLPYEDDSTRDEGFRYREDVEAPDESRYLWGNAAYAFGAVLIRAFMTSGWLAEIRGVSRDEEGGGLVTGLPVQSFVTDGEGVAPKSSTDLVVTDRMEKDLGDLGFIPLCHCKDSEFSAFYGNQSLQKSKVYNELPATMNARISSMLQYMLCVSRFAHYLKVLTQQKVGSFLAAGELENQLNAWINDYVAPDTNASPEVKARFPLRQAEVHVKERLDRPGIYQCVMHLLPHYQLDALSVQIKLRTEVRGQAR